MNYVLNVSFITSPGDDFKLTSKCFGGGLVYQDL